jgi:hypothetical protein
MRRRGPVAVLLATIALVGISPLSAADESSQASPGKSAKGDKSPAEMKQKKSARENNRGKPKAGRRRSATPDELPASVRIGSANLDESRAISRIGGEIRDALSLGNTLVVWLVEQTPAAESLHRVSIDPIVELVQEAGAEYPGRLQVAVLGYASEARWATPNPTSKADELRSALAGLSSDKSGRANVCAAVRQAIDKFALLRSTASQVIFVIVGASSGDDLNEADSVLVALKRAAIPVFGFGPPARFGQTVGQTIRGRMERGPSDEHAPIESLLPERIRLALPGQQGTVDLVDAGYGPFGLERLCRQSGGKFLRLRDVAMMGWEIDPTTGDVKAELLQRYAPDYVNEAQYRKLLAENKCRAALHQASQLPATFGLEATSAEFAQTSNEAQMAQRITTAQQQAALREQPIQQFYDALIAGESDRPKLTGARWQAGYDLAMGQALAAKARLDGYNAMLATLKQGKKFTNPDSKRWVLEPADEISAGSALDKMAKTSRVYLKRVAEEHQGTPWAVIAERELKYPAGWKFEEK